jgi:ATP-binding cassette subfamily F protein 3
VHAVDLLVAPVLTGDNQMSIVSVQGITKSFGGRPVLEPINWTLEDDARIGLVGPNGAGKSTLLRIIAGLEQADEGLVVKRRGLRCAYLPQEVAGDQRTVLETVLANRPDIAELEARLHAIEHQLALPEIVGDSERLHAVLDQQAHLIERLDELGGPRVRNEAVGHLRSLGIADEDFDVPTRQLSGGQRKLVMLAGCLLRQPDLLLLDEPDTHLDLDRKRMLEAMIRGFPGAVIVISHDRYLLDETVTTIAEVEDRVMRIWEGNYSAYAVAKEVALLRQQALCGISSRRATSSARSTRWKRSSARCSSASR